MGVWWHDADDSKMAPATKGLRLPHALTADALAYYVDRIRGYRTTTHTIVRPFHMSEGDEVHSSLKYTASVKQTDRRVIDGVQHKDVFIVDLSLSFTAQQCEGAPFLETVCGFPQRIAFTKKRRVILSDAGGVLAIVGDGKSELSKVTLEHPTHERLAWGLALVDHKQAAVWADAIPHAETRSQAQMKVAQVAEVRERAAGAAIAWARQNRQPPAHKHRPSGYVSHRGHRVTVAVCCDCTEYVVARDWAGVAPKDAAAWAVTIKDAVARESALAVIGTTWTVRDPKEMGAWFQDHVKPVNTRDLVLIHTIRGRAEDEPAQVAELLPYLDNDELRRIGHNIVVDRWAYSQPRCAGNLALTIENKPDRIRMLRHIARVWAEHGNAQNAISWASHISDAGERNQFLDALKIEQ